MGESLEEKVQRTLLFVQNTSDRRLAEFIVVQCDVFDGLRKNLKAYTQEFRKMYSKVIQAQDADQWAPIETAPKNGEPILGYANGKQTTVYWHRFLDDGCWCLYVSGRYAEDGEWIPTHWKPLSENPIEKL